VEVDITQAERLLARAVKNNIIPAMHLFYQLQYLEKMHSGRQSTIDALLQNFGFGVNGDSVRALSWRTD